MKIFFFILTTCCLPSDIFSQAIEIKIQSVYFGGGSYSISPNQIQEIAEFIQSVPSLEHYQIGVSSHTDNIGSLEYNQWLSEMRSEQVVEELIRLNIPKERIIVRENGEETPKYDNNTLNGRLANRRVDIILTPIYL